MKPLPAIWNFFGLYQTKRVRVVHLLILILVITQIIISNWMNASPKGVILHQGAAVANEALQIHKTLTGLIEVYIFGHGFMGLVHFILWYRNKP